MIYVIYSLLAFVLIMFVLFIFFAIYHFIKDSRFQKNEGERRKKLREKGIYVTNMPWFNLLSSYPPMPKCKPPKKSKIPFIPENRCDGFKDEKGYQAYHMQDFDKFIFQLDCDCYKDKNERLN